MIQWALRYQKLGLSVIPLRPRGKEPLIPWTEFQKRKATEQEIQEWFQKWPNANVGVVTGMISGLIVIDLDGSEGIAEAKKLNLTSYIISYTGTGKHLWFRASSHVASSVRIHPGIDIRGEGGFIVAPPSVHVNGKRYRWINVLNVEKLPIFPMSILEKSAETVSPTKKSDGWIAKALEEMKDGNIDNTLVSILGRLRSDGYSANDARSFLEPHTKRVGAEDGHLEEKIENIWNRYEPKRSAGSIQSYTGQSEISGLIIHSPTNPDSLKQFEQSKLAMESANGGECLTTGYSKLDEMLKGGLKSSRLFTIAARTGTGKTNWIIGVARTLCEASKRVLIFSTETPYTEFWQRYIATLNEPGEFSNHALYVCDSFAPNIEKVEEAINEIKPDVFMFDHINHVSEEQRELGAFMQGLNYLRRKYGCAGIVTAQLNRSADWIDLKSGEKVTPRMSMVKGSGTIEQASSRVLLLSEKRILPEGTEIDGMLDKNDNGPKGMVKFMLTNSPYRMIEL
jgi:Bifunctional DNA primase/polymerase, N-terminal/DnaB-like helicase C terminal domain